MKNLNKALVLSTMSVLFSTSFVRAASLTFQPTGPQYAAITKTITFKVFLNPMDPFPTLEPLTFESFTYKYDGNELSLSLAKGNPYIIPAGTSITNTVTIAVITFDVQDKAIKDGKNDFFELEAKVKNSSNTSIPVSSYDEVDVFVPEPLTILGSGLAIGFGAWLKTDFSKKRKKIN